MATILTTEEAAKWKKPFLAWKDSFLEWPYRQAQIMFNSHEALRVEDEARAELIHRLIGRIEVLTAGLRDAVAEIHASLGCDPACEEKRHPLLNLDSEALP